MKRERSRGVRAQRTAGCKQGERCISLVLLLLAARTAAQVQRTSLPPKLTPPAHVTCPVQLQVNMALKALPTFSCLPEDRGQHRTTTHLLPGDEQTVLSDIQRAFEDASAGRLPEFPTIEASRPASGWLPLGREGGRHEAHTGRHASQTGRHEAHKAHAASTSCHMLRRSTGRRQ